MSDASTPPTRQPSLVALIVLVVLFLVFAAKLGTWYRGLVAGQDVTASMTTGDWLRVGFYHVAVVAGIAGIIGLLRERRSSKNERPQSGP